MEKKRIGINFELKFEDIKDINPSFYAAKVAICYAGKNRNYSSISKEVLEAALPTLKNVPIVGRYIEEENDFGAHDIRVKVSDDGFDVENATVPFGVVPESAKQWWESVTEEDGTVRDYLFTECLLWKRQAGYQTLISQDKWNQSMEIDLNRYLIDADNYCVIEDFVWTALCILGNSVEPCFESASIQLTTDKAISNYKQQFSLMLEDMKSAAGDLQKNFGLEASSTKEEHTLLTDEVRDSILKEFNLKIEDLDFEITQDMTEDQLREKLESKATQNATVTASNTEDTGAASVDPDEKGEANSEPTASEPAASEPAVSDPDDTTEGAFGKKLFSATYNEKREALSALLKYEAVWDGDNLISETSYYLDDFDDHYAYFERYVWSAGDTKCDHIRVAYQYNEEDHEAEKIGEPEGMIVKWLTLDEDRQLEEARDAFKELKEFKDKTLKEKHDAEIEGVFAEFKDLEKFTEFENLKKRSGEFKDINDLKIQCYAIRGMKVPASMSGKSDSIRVPIGSVSKTSDSYGGLFTTYGKK